MNEVDGDTLNGLVGKMLGDLGGAFSVPTVRIGYRLGLFESLQKDGPATAAELAKRTGLAARYVREWALAQAAKRTLLKPDAAWMIVEPIAGNTPGDNVGNPVSRLYYNASTMICVPTSLAQEVGEALGAQAGEAKLTEVLKSAGFTRVRRATEGPFNMVLEARP